MVSIKMGYGSNNSYQGYQGGGGLPNNPYRGRRKDYEELRSGGSSEPRMQSMEVLSGREYGLEYERDGEGVTKHRWTLYGLVGFLLLVVLVAPHHDNSSSNLQMDKGGKENATKQPADTSISASTQYSPSPSSARASSDDEWVVTSAPAVIDFSETNPSAAFITDCHLPPTFRLGADNNIYLNVTNFCLAEVGQTMYQMSNQPYSISTYSYVFWSSLIFLFAATAGCPMYVLRPSETSNTKGRSTLPAWSRRLASCHEYEHCTRQSVHCFWHSIGCCFCWGFHYGQ
jgi:hypothetical protein